MAEAIKHQLCLQGFTGSSPGDVTLTMFLPVAVLLGYLRGLAQEERSQRNGCLCRAGRDLAEFVAVFCDMSLGRRRRRKTERKVTGLQFFSHFSRMNYARITETTRET